MWQTSRAMMIAAALAMLAAASCDGGDGPAGSAGAGGASGAAGGASGAAGVGDAAGTGGGGGVGGAGGAEAGAPMCNDRPPCDPGAAANWIKSRAFRSPTCQGRTCANCYNGAAGEQPPAGGCYLTASASDQILFASGGGMIPEGATYYCVYPNPVAGVVPDCN